MKEIQRYDLDRNLDCILGDDSGRFVSFKDHAAIVAVLPSPLDNWRISASGVMASLQFKGTKFLSLPEPTGCASSVWSWAHSNRR